jgi:hypothetical protein
MGNDKTVSESKSATLKTSSGCAQDAKKLPELATVLDNAQL